MKKLLKVFAFLVVPSAYFLVPITVLAVCPVCTVAVVAGLGLSRYFGIDDTVSGIWIGGLILSSSFWLIDWLGKKKYKISKFKYLNLVVIIITYLIVLGPLFLGNIIGHPFNKFWGIDKLILGTFFGSFTFLFGLWIDRYTRKLKGQQLFQFQKVAFPIIALIIASGVFYLITK